MRDAFGGLMNIIIIVVFLVIVSGYLAFNVTYTKAFRVKNKIITTIEQYEGNCGNESSACDKEILSYMKELGYSPETTLNIEGYECKNGYCIKRIEPERSVNAVNDQEQKVYYKVVTAISIDIPIINKIMPQLKIFQVSGTTKQFVPTSSGR